MRLMKCFMLLTLMGLGDLLQALPAQIIIIRHAEKPVKGNQLNLQGRARAVALVPFFIGSPEVLTYGTPVAIYAQRPGSKDPSLRCIETMTPLSEALNLPLNTNYERDAYPGMVETIKSNPAYEGKMVLICWSHDNIPKITKLFGALDMPKKWHSDEFDRMWVITFQLNGAVVTVDNLPQRLMFKDTSK